MKFLRARAAATITAACVLGASCDSRPSDDKRLGQALQNGDTNYLKKYLDSGGKVNRSILPAMGQRIPAPLLDYAVFYGHTQAVEFLLRNGANPNQPDGAGNLPVTWVMGASVPQGNRVEMFNMLLKNGADPNLRERSTYQYTPLHSAASFGQPEIVEILLSMNADVNATNTIGQTPLHLAENAETARLLIKAGADPNFRSSYGETPGDFALKRQRLDVLRVLTNTPPRGDGLKLKE